MERCIGQSPEGFQCQVSVLSSVQSECVTLLASLCDNTERVLPTRKLPVLWCSELLLGLHYRGMIDDCPHGWTQVSWFCVTQSPQSQHTVGLSGVASSDPNTVGCGHPDVKIPRGQLPPQDCCCDRPHLKGHSYQVWRRLPSRGQGKERPDISLGEAKFFTAHKVTGKRWKTNLNREMIWMECSILYYILTL